MQTDVPWEGRPRITQDSLCAQCRDTIELRQPTNPHTHPYVLGTNYELINYKFSLFNLLAYIRGLIYNWISAPRLVFWGSFYGRSKASHCSRLVGDQHQKYGRKYGVLCFYVTGAKLLLDRTKEPWESSPSFNKTGKFQWQNIDYRRSI